MDAWHSHEVCIAYRLEKEIVAPCPYHYYPMEASFVTRLNDNLVGIIFIIHRELPYLPSKQIFETVNRLMNVRDSSQKKTYRKKVFSSLSHQENGYKLKLLLDFCLTWVIMATIKKQTTTTKIE